MISAMRLGGSLNPALIAFQSITLLLRIAPLDPQRLSRRFDQAVVDI